MVTRGAVVFISLDPTLGHEQAGDRPCVVVSAEGAVASLRFPVLAVVPLTSTPGVGLLYPAIRPTNENGLRNPSTALTDQIRAVDKRRVRRLLGQLAASDLALVEDGLRAFLGLP
jgi:mRNA interferase MazF